MNDKTFQAYIDANRGLFEELAKCGSVAELMIRLAAYGKGWNRWSWAVFVFFLWDRITREKEVSTFGRRSGDDDKARDLLDDIIATVDEGTALDSIVKDKVVVEAMLQIARSRSNTSDCGGLLCVLAHAFAKFPAMWNVNWMFVRHSSPKKKAVRTHKLAAFVPCASHRPPGYFSSDAFMNDFIYKYWDYSRYR